MFALIVTACLSADPSQCGDHLIGWMPYETAAECRVASRQRMAAWALQNAELAMQSFNCIGGRGTSDAREPNLVMASQALD